MRSANLFFFTQPQETFEAWYQAQQNTPFEEKVEQFFVEFQQIPINYGTITDTAYQDSLYWKEQHLYGSSRLGIAKPELEVTNYTPSNASSLTTNFRNYELTNHLGNILATIKDEKQQVSLNGTTVDYYEPIVITANDYYPFGMVMPNRSFSLAGSNYRFGFNTQEKDDEVYGKGNLMTADYWEYDTRIGRRWNTDLIEFADLSPYAVFDNNPIFYNDQSGLTPEETIENGGGGSGEVEGDGGGGNDGSTTYEPGSRSGEAGYINIVGGGKGNNNGSSSGEGARGDNNNSGNSNSKADKLFNDVKETNGTFAAYFAKTAFMLVQGVTPTGRAMNKAGLYNNTHDVITGEKLDLSAKGRIVSGGSELAQFVALPRNLIFNTISSINEMSNHKNKSELRDVTEIGRFFSGFSTSLYGAVTHSTQKFSSVSIFGQTVNAYYVKTAAYWLNYLGISINSKNAYKTTKELIDEKNKTNIK